MYENAEIRTPCQVAGLQRLIALAVVTLAPEALSPSVSMKSANAVRKRKRILRLQNSPLRGRHTALVEDRPEVVWISYSKLPRLMRERSFYRLCVFTQPRA